MGIYLDYQASTPVDPRVSRVMLEVTEQDFANPSSESHSAGWAARARIENSRAAIGEAIGCEADEIVFTSGATEADNLGVLGAALGAPASRRRILIGATEHKAVIESAIAAKRFGFEVEFLPVNRCGLIEIAAFRRSLDDTVAVVSVMAVNNEIGTIQPLRDVVTHSREVGAFVHTDATQATCAMDVDVVDWGVDAASFSSHKIYGPKGIGALYLSAAAPWRPMPLLFGGGQEQGLRPGTLPTPLCVGFAKAVEIIAEEGARERQRVAEMRDAFARLLCEQIPNFQPTVQAASCHPGNLHARFIGIEADDLLAQIQPHISAATGSACTSGQIHGSHVLDAIGLNQAEAREGIRFSIGRFSNMRELKEAVTQISAAISKISASEQPR